MGNLLAVVKAVFTGRGEFGFDIRETYFALRVSIGVTGLALPVVLVAKGLAHGLPWERMESISVFYWLSQCQPEDANAFLRTWLVGSLVSVGVCLIAYRGYGFLEDRLLNLAGTAAIAVALFPMPSPSSTASPRCDFSLHLDPWHAHYIAAVTFFAAIAATIWFCAGDTLVANPNETTRKWWQRVYWAFAIAMLLVPFAAIMASENLHRTIWIEAAGITVFAFYWFVKTYELFQVSDVESRTGTLPKIRRVEGRLEIERQ